ncbi:DMT family transporter [Bacillus salipaludis]|uniref:DMT family transporter n=1 Tax=Bacillus salipaludis TaxID=2547811 RepID=A0A4R5VR88_9BACI|nr:DMT family transporter [Bacillus salipaludis]TDK60994.1 DMT family transporter [Bacillus salipaludis]
MRRFSPKTFAAIAGLVLIWGFSWPLYKVALAYTPPILFAGMRPLIGGILLSTILIPQWKKIKWRENWRTYFISALLNTFLFFGLQTIGLNFLPGGLFSVLVYFQPVLIGLLGWLWLGEKMSIIKITGLVVGFLGVAAVSSEGFTGHVSILGIVLALATAIFWAIGVIYVKKVSHKVDSLWMVGMQSLIGGMVLTGIGIVTEDWSSIVWNGKYLFGLSYGSILGVAAAYILYFKLVNSGEATKVASFTFLVPLIAVLVGTVFLGEKFTYSLLVGLILIVISIYFVNHSGKKHELNTKEPITFDA